VVADVGKEESACVFRIKPSKTNIHAELPEHEDEDITFLGNTRNHAPNKNVISQKT
jgi:hypothetical protein